MGGLLHGFYELDSHCFQHRWPSYLARNIELSGGIRIWEYYSDEQSRGPSTVSRSGPVSFSMCAAVTTDLVISWVNTKPPIFLSIPIVALISVFPPSPTPDVWTRSAASTWVCLSSTTSRRRSERRPSCAGTVGDFSPYSLWHSRRIVDSDVSLSEHI